GYPRPPQTSYRLHPLFAGAMRDRERGRRTIQQAELAVGAIAANPLASAPLTDLSGLGRPLQRPSVINDSPAEIPALVQAERSVSVQIHPVSSLGLRCLAALSFQGGPDEPTYSGTTTSDTMAAAHGRFPPRGIVAERHV